MVEWKERVTFAISILILSVAMKFKKRKENHTILYVVIQESTKEVSIYKEITPLSEKIGVDRSTIYRKFKDFPESWSKNGFTVYKTTNIFIKSRRGK